MFKRMKAVIFPALLLVAMAGAFGAYEYQAAKPVSAAAGDSYATFFGNGSSVGVVVTGVAAKKIIIKQIIITAQSSMAVVLQENPASGSNTTFGQVSLLANVPYEIPNSMLQAGASGTDGYVLATAAGLDVVNQNLGSSVLSIWVRYALN